LPKEKKNKQVYSLVNEAIEKKILETENGVTYWLVATVLRQQYSFIIYNYLLMEKMEKQVKNNEYICPK
jgi:hypothetical protein